VSKIFIFLIRIYQTCFSLFLGRGKCRFHPSCSNYFIESVKKYGVVKGGFFGFIRICKCHPWSKGGIDDVK